MFGIRGSRLSSAPEAALCAPAALVSLYAALQSVSAVSPAPPPAV